jgi:methanogenic corrinoid protein MtbC1
MGSEDNMKALSDAIFDGRSKTAIQALQNLKNQNTDPEMILKLSVLPSINSIGASMAEGDFFMPEVKVSAKALKEVAEGLRSYIIEKYKLTSINAPPWTGEGDIDDIGEYLQSTMENSRDNSVPELMGIVDMIAHGLDDHEFTPCKIQGSEVKQ